MKIKDLVERVNFEIEQEMEEKFIKLAKEKKKEIMATKIILAKLEKEYDEFLETDVEELVFP